MTLLEQVKARIALRKRVSEEKKSDVESDVESQAEREARLMNDESAWVRAGTSGGILPQGGGGIVP